MHTVIVPCLYITDVVCIACIEDSLPAKLSQSDCFCITNDQGKKICNPENCDADKDKLSVSSQLNIFLAFGQFQLIVVCIFIPTNHYYVRPFNNYVQVQSHVQQEDCFCIENGEGAKVCQPPNCDENFMWISCGNQLSSDILGMF